MAERRTRIPLPEIKDCNDCGVCCTGQEGLPLTLIGDSPSESVNPLPPELVAELLEFKRKGRIAKDSDCLWYDSELLQCRHYEYRPVLCRDGVKVGDEHCRHWREIMGIC